MSDLPRPVETPIDQVVTERPLPVVDTERPIQYSEPAAPARPARPEPADYNPQGTGWRNGYNPPDYSQEYG